MKALTIREPWGFAIIDGGKPIENRTWNTTYRGPLAIHTSAKVDLGYVHEAMSGPYFDPTLTRDFARAGRPLDLKYGTFVGVVTLTGIHHATDCVDARGEYCSPWAMPNTWHWQLEDPAGLKHPLPAKGRLQLWDPTPDDLLHLTGCLYGWATIPERDSPRDVHVVPMRDQVVHKADDSCVCGPTRKVACEDHPDGWVITHHSLDGREATEVRGCRHD